MGLAVPIRIDRAYAKRAPIEQIDTGLYLKRCDLWGIGGHANGGKLRGCLGLLLSTARRHDRWPSALVTSATRWGSQSEVVAEVGWSVGVPARVHVPRAARSTWSPHLVRAAATDGTEIVEHTPGHLSVIEARARSDAQGTLGALLVPFGMVCTETVVGAAGECQGLPRPLGTIVVPVGGGANASGVWRGVQGEAAPPQVIGVQVGRDPRKVLNGFKVGPSFSLVSSQRSYADALLMRVGEITLHPIYEAKAWEWMIMHWGSLRKPVLFWIVGGAP